MRINSKLRPFYKLAVKQQVGWRRLAKAFKNRPKSWKFPELFYFGMNPPFIGFVKTTRDKEYYVAAWESQEYEGYYEVILSSGFGGDERIIAGKKKVAKKDIVSYMKKLMRMR